MFLLRSSQKLSICAPWTALSFSASFIPPSATYLAFSSSTLVLNLSFPFESPSISLDTSLSSIPVARYIFFSVDSMTIFSPDVMVIPSSSFNVMDISVSSPSSCFLRVSVRITFLPSMRSILS